MTGPSLEDFLDLLRRDFPDCVIVVRPFDDPDEEGIQHFVHLLNVPEDELDSIAWRSLEKAFQFYGSTQLPFHLTTIGPETSIKHFEREIEDALWLHTPSLVQARSTCSVQQASIGTWEGDALWVSRWSDDALRECRSTFLPEYRQPRTPDPTRSSTYLLADRYSLAS